MRYRARTDHNQKAIVKCLRDAGCKVVDLSAVGKGITDLLVGWDGVLHLLECKNMTGRTLIRGQPQLTDDQVEFHEEWKDYPIHVVTNPLQALIAVGVEFEIARCRVT